MSTAVYSDRVMTLLRERKGDRAPLYLAFKETRGRHFLQRLLDAAPAPLTVLEVGCSFGHVTEYLHEHPAVGSIDAYDVDRALVDVAQVKREELRLTKVRRLLALDDEATTRLPFVHHTYDLVLAIGVVEHLPPEDRERYVNEWWRVLKPGGSLAILDTPNRAFPLETHSVGLPAIQWLPPRFAFAYARLCRAQFRGVSFAQFDRHGAWRNASWRECWPTREPVPVDVTEASGYGWRFFRDTARSSTRRTLLPLFTVACGLLRLVGLSPSLALPYFNLILRKPR